MKFLVKNLRSIDKSNTIDRIDNNGKVGIMLDILKYPTSTKESHNLHPSMHQPQQHVIIKIMQRSLDKYYIETSPSYYI